MLGRTANVSENSLRFVSGATASSSPPRNCPARSPEGCVYLLGLCGSRRNYSLRKVLKNRRVNEFEKNLGGVFVLGWGVERNQELKKRKWGRGMERGKGMCEEIKGEAGLYNVV